MSNTPLEARLEKVKNGYAPGEVYLEHHQQKQAIAVIEKLKEALEKYADENTHSMDESGFIYCGD